MNVSWWQLLRAIPGLKGAIAPVGETKDWYKSSSILYQLIKAGVTLCAALGIYGVMSTEDMQTISTTLAIAIPAVLTLCDALAAIWLRLRTSAAITGTVLAQQIDDAATVLPTTGTVDATVQEIQVAKAEEPFVVVAAAEDKPTVGTG